MNNLKVIEVEYLRADRTIETILLSKKKKEKVMYVYNYQGWFFRVFDNLMDIMNFFDDKFEPEVYFENEKELDEYLLKLKL